MPGAVPAQTAGSCAKRQAVGNHKLEKAKMIGNNKQRMYMGRWIQQNTVVQTHAKDFHGWTLTKKCTKVKKDAKIAGSLCQNYLLIALQGVLSI